MIVFFVWQAKGQAFLRRETVVRGDRRYRRQCRDHVRARQVKMGVLGDKCYHRHCHCGHIRVMLCGLTIYFRGWMFLTLMRY